MAEHSYCDSVGLFIFCITNSNILTLALSILMFEKFGKNLSEQFKKKLVLIW